MKKYLITSLFLIFMPIQAVAKKVYDYVPPSYAERVMMSFVALFPIAFLFGHILYFFHSRFNQVASKSRLRWYATVLLLSLAGSLLAASDSLNDELWNPALYGGFVIAFVAPFSFLILNTKLKPITKWICIVISYPAFGAVMLIATWYWTYLGTGLFGHFFGWRLAW